MLSFANISRCQIRKLETPARGFIRNLHRGPIPVSWKRPRIGWTKLNFDGSCKGKAGEASIGGLFRNHEAEFLLGYAESIGRATSTVAELAALRRGLELVLENGWSNVWLEGDSKSLVDIIVKRRRVRCKEAQKQVRRINLIMPELENCVVTHVFREGNRAADKLASIGHQLQKPKIWRHIPPDDILQIVEEDAKGMIVFRRR
ncbi:Ribonuclease protein [Salix suchowensis]|nr:Ribonuclease protein [Salix suchowensis]